MLQVENLEVVYDDVIYAVKGVSINVEEGKVMAALGPNGSGKTTMLRAIAGILKSQEGEVTGGNIRFNDHDLTKIPPEKIYSLGLSLIPEHGGLFSDLTTEENLRLGAASVGRQGASLDKVWEWFPRLHERAKVRAGYLSGGEQQMLAMGRALLSKPKLLMLDEPSLGLAPTVVKELFSFIQRLNKEEGVTILLVEQNASLTLGIADYGYILENGRIVLDGTAKDLLADKEVRQYYLGLGQESQRRSYRDAKHYKTRKRWLS
ncbi:MAG: ABC transporter ATP-binding protein [Thermincola sp.]|jgi:branched-chain amino acid transport system ATP-binding protein|nr:ABC transporter ATP-binding protein [Thermincola sp.]MDT3704990.1 ABC transporter ATP-binding protein [Thermincola sp.]